MPGASADSTTESVIGRAVHQVHDDHLTKARDEINQYAKTHSAAENISLSMKFFGQLSPEERAKMAGALFEKNSAAASRLDTDRSGSFSDAEQKAFLASGLGSALERTAAAYMLMNSERLSGGTGQITPESLKRESTPFTMPDLALVDNSGAATKDSKQDSSQKTVKDRAQEDKRQEKQEAHPQNAGLEHFQENTLGTGAKIATSESGDRLVSRSDGTQVLDCKIDGKRTIVETKANATTAWTIKDGTAGAANETWVSNPPGQERQNLTLEKNGNLTFKQNGEKHIIRSNGAELVEGQGRTTFDFDESGRIARVNYADSTTSFGFKYKGNSENIDSVDAYDRKSNQITTFKPNSSWGNPKIAPDGTYSQENYQSLNGKTFIGKQTFGTHGNDELNQLNSDGSVSITDSLGRRIGTRATTGADFSGLTPGSRFEQAMPVSPVTPEAREVCEQKEATDASRKPVNEPIAQSRAALEKQLIDSMPDEHFRHRKAEKIKSILDNFEHKAIQDRTDGLAAASDDQIVRTYRNALSLLKDEGKLSRDWREKLVLEGLRNLSDVEGIDQGFNGTCGNTCGEKFIAQRSPDVYMDALRQVVQSGGHYRAPDGRLLTLPWDEMKREQAYGLDVTWQRGWKPDAEASGWDVFKEQGFHPFHSNERRRNYASQIIQNLNRVDAIEQQRRGEVANGPQALDGLNFIHVENFTKRMTGSPMTTINQSVPTEGNIMQPLSDQLAVWLKEQKRLPAMVWRAAHWQTINDVRVHNGVVQVWSDNQWGNRNDRGWETIPQLQAELQEGGALY
ncbi:MAG TPA: hypothetical protein V6C97_23625 [Oculatellaceae cyanobacterium]